MNILYNILRGYPDNSFKSRARLGLLHPLQFPFLHSALDLLSVARRHNVNIIMTSSQDDAIIIRFGSLLHFCRWLQAEESRKKYVEKYEKKR